MKAIIIILLVFPLISRATNYTYTYSGNNNILITNSTFGTLNKGDNVFITYLVGGWRSITMQGLKTGQNVTYNDTTTFINIRFINGAYITPSSSQLQANGLDSCQGVRIAYMIMQDHADIGFRIHGPNFPQDIWIDHYNGSGAAGFGPLPVGTFGAFTGDTTKCYRNWRWSYCTFDTSYGTNSGQIAISCANGLATNAIWLGARIDHCHFNYYSSATGGANFVSGDNCYGCIMEYDTMMNLGVVASPNGHTATMKWDAGWWICRYNMCGPGNFGNDFRTKNTDMPGIANYTGVSQIYDNICHHKRKYPFVEAQEPNSSFISSMGGIIRRRRSPDVINNTCYSMAMGAGVGGTAYLTAVLDNYPTDTAICKNNTENVLSDTTYLLNNTIYMISPSTGPITYIDSSYNKIGATFVGSGLKDTLTYIPGPYGVLYNSGVVPPSYITQDYIGNPRPNLAGRNGGTGVDIGALQLLFPYIGITPGSRIIIH